MPLASYNPRLASSMSNEELYVQEIDTAALREFYASPYGVDLTLFENATRTFVKHDDGSLQISTGLFYRMPDGAIVIGDAIENAEKIISKADIDILLGKEVVEITPLESEKRSMLEKMKREVEELLDRKGAKSPHEMFPALNLQKTVSLTDGCPSIISAWSVLSPVGRVTEFTFSNLSEYSRHFDAVETFRFGDGESKYFKQLPKALRQTDSDRVQEGITVRGIETGLKAVSTLREALASM